MKRALYFGTDGCPGHSAIPLEGEFSSSEISTIVRLVDSFNLEKLFVGGHKFRWFNMGFTIDDNAYKFFGYAVPYSPDDNRGGSKSVIIVENGSMEDIRTLFYSNRFLMNKFNKIWDTYKYKEEERI